MPSSHLILCHPLLLLPSIFPSIRVFSNESARHIRRTKYWHFSFSVSPSNSGLISFRKGWIDLLAVQRTLRSLLQYHRSRASILQCWAFFMVQLSHLHIWIWLPHFVLSQERPLEKETATHFSILARIIPRAKEPSELRSMRSVAHDWATLHVLCPEITYLLLPPSLESVIGHGNHGAMIWKCA